MRKKNAEKNKRKMMYGNQIVWRMLFVFLAMASIISAIACYFAYQQKKEELLAVLNKQLLQVEKSYSEIRKDFWNIYMPVFENEKDVIFLTEYFQNSSSTVNPLTQLELRTILSRIAARDDKIQWVAMFSPVKQKNYIYIVKDNILMGMPDDFPYLEQLNHKNLQMEVYGREEIQVGDYQYKSIAIAGGKIGNNIVGNILVGYDVADLDKLCQVDCGIESWRYYILWEDIPVYCSDTWQEWPLEELKLGKNDIYEINGEKWYIQVSDEEFQKERIFYAVKWKELFWNAGRGTQIVLIISGVIMGLAIWVYFFTMDNITKEVNIICDGLNMFAQSQLNYQIHTSFNQPEFVIIAEAINRMARQLKENVERSREYEKRQKEAEMQELMAKFNPHFLYNTLEVFRRRCFENGDDETAELMAQTASIFRGFIGADTFIPMEEELAFSKKYLNLYQARYEDSVTIIYDIETEVLKYGIVRNVFQPLIENYFEHGYDTSNDNNCFWIKGRIKDEKDIVFLIEDNGMGIEEKKLLELNNLLNTPITLNKDSYGLRNLNQRLRLFYGDGYGLMLKRNDVSGLTVEIRIKKIKCE